MMGSPYYMRWSSLKIEIVGISLITYVDYSYDVIQKYQWHNKGAVIPVYKGSPKANDIE
jgi:pyrimidine-specific ribonucleoside hydrolase